MSTAQDEAKDGPDSNSEEDFKGEKRLRHPQSEVSQGTELPTPKVAEPNVVLREDDRSSGFARRTQDVESEESGSLRAPRLSPGRPSSADGSLSIPDDTPSVQVSAILAQADALSNKLSDL
jgi:hypothetical protein